MKRVWDLLRVTFSRHDGGSVTLTYDREALNDGDSLVRSQRIDSWPEVTVVSHSDDGVVLNVLLGGAGQVPVQCEINLENQPVTIPVGEPHLPGELIFTMMSFTLKITEHDDFEEIDRHYYLDDRDWEAAENGDADAALRIADAVAEQAPEALEIIADYMARAATLGSRDAQDWLAEYYRGDNGRYDAYS